MNKIQKKQKQTTYTIATTIASGQPDPDSETPCIFSKASENKHNWHDQSQICHHRDRRKADTTLLLREFCSSILRLEYRGSMDERLKTEAADEADLMVV